jgi:hypothetical protein
MSQACRATAGGATPLRNAHNTNTMLANADFNHNHTKSNISSYIMISLPNTSIHNGKHGLHHHDKHIKASS